MFGRRCRQALVARPRPQADPRRGGSSLKLYLVRHAKAGSRSAWNGPDEERPLSKAGRRQAAALAKLLRDEPIGHVVSSAYVRCRETVAPLAERLGLPVEDADALSEGAPLSEALRLIDKVSDKPTVLCTHGDVIGELLHHWASQHARLDAGDDAAPSELRFPKGSTWVLDVEDGQVVRGHFLPAT
ncbi:MAG TPA: phosphoglycerate mutase family protein [Acidimicrobiia bacterium]|nr:phosphoglycerate mutase family protein [Acidimicrobiia bacterium]